MLGIKSIMKIILISLGASTAFWILNSATMSYVLHSGSFLDQFFQPDMHHLWMRVPVVLLSVPIVTLIIRFGAKKAELKEVRKLLPICAWCGKKIRDAEGNWKQVEVYIKEYTGADTTHGMCPECYKLMTKEDSKENNNIKVT